MKKSLPQLILDHLFGRKYYFVALRILDGRRPQVCQLCSYIFESRQLAQNYINTSVHLSAGAAKDVGIYSFRSRVPLPSDYNPNRHYIHS